MEERAGPFGSLRVNEPGPYKGRKQDGPRRIYGQLPGMIGRGCVLLPLLSIQLPTCELRGDSAWQTRRTINLFWATLTSW